jgi:acetolactate synthase-1/3 small subunit
MKYQQTPGFQKFIIAVYAHDKKGLLGQILMHFNRNNFEVSSLNVSSTDIHEVKLITITVTIPEGKLKLMLNKIENIVEVYKAYSFPYNDVKFNMVAYYRMSKNIMNTSLWPDIQRHGGSIIEMMDDSFIIQKTGTDSDINDLYQKLDGKYLISYCNSGLVVSQSLVPLDMLFS